MQHETRIPGARLWATGAAVAVAALGLAACGSSGSSTTGGSGSGSGKTVKFTLNDDGCTPKNVKIASGSTTFNGTGNSAKVTEFEVLSKDGIILGERENLTPGLDGGFTLNLQPGTYDISCSTGDHAPTGTLVVSGQAVTQKTADAALTRAAVDGYKAYVEDQVATLVKNTKKFVAAVKAGDTQKAKDLFAVTRANYEAVEPVAESFGDLDPQIDARKNDVAKGDPWTGFHAIEQILWQKNTTKGTSKLADRLQTDVETLQKKAATLDYQAPQLANGAVELLNEVANSKISGEEDRYSHTDLSDFAANVAGAEKAFTLLIPVLQKNGDAALVTTIKARFAAVDAALAKYQRPDDPSGWATYSALTAADRKTLSQAVDALAEPLSTVAAKTTAS
jgi:iron uptake system component EfeO